VYLQVVLSDNEDRVLLNLRDCVASNSEMPAALFAGPSTTGPPKAGASPHNSTASAQRLLGTNTEAAASASDNGDKLAAAGVPVEQDLFDPDDADSCDDLDNFFTGTSQAADSASGKDATPWDYVSGPRLVPLCPMFASCCLCTAQLIQAGVVAYMTYLPCA